MSRAIQPIVYIVLAWLMVGALASCALAPAREVPAQAGRVLDEATQQPVEGAIVVLRWQGVGTKGLVDTETVCYHVESAVTDSQGNYATAPWKEESRFRDLGMKQILETVYKPSYRHMRLDRTTRNQYLRQDTRSVKERLEYVVGIMRSVGCNGAGESQRRLYPLRGSIYYEAKSLNASPERLQWIREVAANSAVATSHGLTGPERDQAVKEFLKENLQ